MDQENQPYNAPAQVIKPKRTGLIIGIIVGVFIIILLGVIVFLLMPGGLRNNADLLRQRADEARQTAAELQQNADQVRNSQNQVPANNVQTTPTTPTTQVNTPAPATVVTPVSTTAVADYAGEWNGSYAPSSLVSSACKGGGNVNLSINSSGSVAGYVVYKSRNVPGTGNVDKNGNISGSWEYSGLSVKYTGKLNTTTNVGSGTYKDGFGCFGSFSVRR